MAAARQSKAKKHAILDSEQPGTSSPAPAKKSKKSSHKSDSTSKEELRLHQAIERSIQKALKEASIKEVQHPAPILVQASTPASPNPAPPVQTPALSPDGDAARLPDQGQINEELFGPQLAKSPPVVHSPGPSTAPDDIAPQQGEEERQAPLI